MKVLPRITRLLSLYVLAAIAAAGLAVAIAHTEPANVYAANHCTRYAPIISVDSNCTVKGTMYNSSNGIYSTPSNGLRDQNTISLNSSRTWTIAYYGGNYSSASGTGTVGHIYSSNGYAQARCWFLGASVTGYCMTNWHD